MRSSFLTPMRRALLAGASAVLVACGGSDGDSAAAPEPMGAPTLSFVAPGESLDLANYTLAGRYNLPVGSGANLLASEVSAVTWNPDTNTLFIVGDNGTSITQISKTGQVIDTMTLPADPSKPQGTYYYDPEGLAYVGGGKFVMAEERYRQAVLFSYTPNTTLDPATAKTVKLGTTIGNVGLEGVTYDPVTGGYLFAKEKTPLGIFQTAIDFNAGTATNGSATTENSTNLFDPALLGALADFGDLYALANVLPANAADRAHLVVLSQESGKLLKVDRSGKVYGTLNLELAAQHEGVTFDRDLNLYVTNELGTAGTAGEQLWVYRPTTSAAAVGVGSHLYLTFPRAVRAGTGNIVLSGANGDVRNIPVTDTNQVRFDGTTVRVDPSSDLAAGVAYTIQFAAGVFVEAANGVATQAATSANGPKFTTVSDVTAPSLSAVTPADNAIGVTGSRVTLTFDETVKAGTGTITISNGADDVRVINASDRTQVTISGQTVDINPSADLRPGTAYHVLVAGNAITDLSGNAFGGIGNPTQLNFVTAASAVPTVLNAGDIAFVGVNGDAPDAIAFVLLTAVNTNTEINFSDRDSLTATNEAAFKWVADRPYPAGTVVTIQTDASPPVADKGLTVGVGGGISTSSETYIAFQGTIEGLTNSFAGNLSVARYLAAINVGGAAGPLDPTLDTALRPVNAFVSLPLENVRFTGSLNVTNPSALRALIADPANWTGSDTVVNALTAGSMFP
ncbi:MAG: hypothetical protein RIS35_317 [Pseudomonadota bacterium]